MIAACEVGHDTHQDILIDVVLDGPVVAIPDIPPVPKRLALEFPMLVWDWTRYSNTQDYCPGNDEVSMSIDMQGMWEGWGTVLTLDILTDPGLVIDIGAHVGWYTLLAGLTGHDTIAVEANAENVRLLNLNLAMNGLRADVRHTWIDDLTPVFEVDGQVRLIKMDIEGTEDQAVRACLPLLQAGQVDYLLMEVSPILADHYPQTVELVEALGYRPFVIPARPNRTDPKFGRMLKAFASAPRGTIQQFPLRDWDFDQRDVLFIRNDLCS